jgi:hypothetical protein
MVMVREARRDRVILAYHLFRCRVPEYICDKHISRQLGQRFGNETETGFQPWRSRAIAMMLYPRTFSTDLSVLFCKTRNQ